MKRSPASTTPGRGPTALAAAAFLLLLLVPTGLPLWNALTDAAAWRMLSSDLPRIGRLYLTTFSLALCIAAIALPAGTMLALVLFRFRVFARNVILALLAAAGFVPLSLYVGAWQACLGPTGFVDLRMPGAAVPGGLWAVVAVHSFAVVPWICGVVGLALRHVDRTHEESGLLDAGPGVVIRMVTLPLVRSSLVFAGLVAIVPVLTDMSASDLFQVRTLAEEIYVQLTDSLGNERTAILALLPAALLAAFAMAKLLPKWVGSGLAPARETLLFSWRRDTVGWGVAAALTGAVLLLPLVGLLWQLGLVNSPEDNIPSWSASVGLHYFLQAAVRTLPLLAADLLRSSVVALLVVSAAVLMTWWRRWQGGLLRSLSLFVVGWLFVIPGPAVALGLIDLFQASWIPASVAGWYDTVLPLAWGQAVRTLPFALIVVDAGMQRLEQETFETALLAGTPPWRMLWEFAVLPMRKTLAAAAGLVITIAMTEMSVSKLLFPPGAEPTPVRVFSLLHQGTQNEQAAMCLTLALAVAIPLVCIAVWMDVNRRLQQRN